MKKNFEGIQWVESNGADLLNDAKTFEKFCDPKCAPVLQYLLSKGLTLNFMLGGGSARSRFFVDSGVLRTVFKVRGLEEIQNEIPVGRIGFDCETVEFLISIGYKFDLQKIVKDCNDSGANVYGLVFHGILKMSDLGNNHQSEIKRRAIIGSLPLCKEILPFVRPIRKKKTIIILMVLKRMNGNRMPKEIMWKIIHLVMNRTT